MYQPGLNDDESSRGEARGNDHGHVSGGALGRGQAPCRHLRGGMCTTHGVVGRKYLRPVSTITEGADGRQIKKTVRKTLYKCDLGPRGRGRAYQTQLSFVRTTGQQRAAVNTIFRGSNFNASKVGQIDSTSMNTREVVDEN